MFELIRDWWPVVLSVLAAIAWLIRLESRGISNEREIRRLWLQRREDLADAKEARDRTNDLLREMRGDIKMLLSRRD